MDGYNGITSGYSGLGYLGYAELHAKILNKWICQRRLIIIIVLFLIVCGIHMAKNILEYLKGRQIGWFNT
jgi:hypothetical protein